MMAKYLSNKTIEFALSELRKTEVNEPMILFTFAILKGCGYNRTSFTSTKNLTELGFSKASRISYLFSPEEKPPNKYDFCNPFSLGDWSSQPSEPLKKWSGGRIINNVLGGARTWRKLVEYDAATEQFKFKYNYLDVLTEMVGSKPINLPALAIWANRFTTFKREYTITEIINEFTDDYQLDEREIDSLFNTSLDHKNFAYSDEMHDTEKIRKLLNNPPDTKNWSRSIINDGDDNISASNTRSFKMPTEQSSHITKDRIIDLLNNYHQVILTGPPGTSKSFLADQVKSDYSKVVKLQFHPQYSYQEFIGGHVVEGAQVIYKQGVLLDLLDYLKSNPKQNCLLIIDEINRANISQVFGEVIQCLDRNYQTEMNLNGTLKSISLPLNLHILGTMNSSDRTIGSMDHAIRRRFMIVHCPPNPEELIELTSFEDNFSLHDFLKKLNVQLVSHLKNKELVIGQTFFYADNLKKNDKFVWDFEKFEVLFNNRILPMVEEFCYGDAAKVSDVLGERLPQRLTGNEFKEAILAYVSV